MGASLDVTSWLKRFTDYWQDMDNIYFHMQKLATVVSFAVGASVTLLLIYLGWLYTHSKQVERERREERNRQREQQVTQEREMTQPTEFDDSDPVTHAHNSDQTNLWQCDNNSDLRRYPKDCPMSKLYTDVSKMSEALAADINADEGGAADDDAPRPRYEVDPVGYCEHIQSEYKRSQQAAAAKKVEQQMTAEQKEHERDIQREQLKAIFSLMEQHQETFGVKSIDDMNQQVKLYM